MRPRFSVGSLLWGVVVISLALSWWTDRTRLAKALRAKSDLCDRLTEHLENCGRRNASWVSEVRKLRAKLGALEADGEPLDPFGYLPVPLAEEHLPPKH